MNVVLRIISFVHILQKFPQSALRSAELESNFLNHLLPQAAPTCLLEAPVSLSSLDCTRRLWPFGRAATEM